MAATSGGELLLAVGGGEVYGSGDLGCSFEQLDRGAGEAYYSLSAQGDGEGVWLLSGSASDGEGALTRFVGAGSIDTIKIFAGGEGWIPDSLAWWSEDGRSGVLAAGAAPEPRLWKGELHDAGEQTQWTWTSWPLFGFATDTAHLRLTDIGDDGRLWLVATDGDGRTLMAGDFNPDGPPEFTIVHSPAQTLMGPVRHGQGALAVFDGVLKRGDWSSGVPTWTPLGESTWTSLGQRDGELFACSLTHIDSIGAEPGAPMPTTQTVFLLDALQGPDVSCLAQEAAQACESDWVHFGAEAGLYEPPSAPPPEASSDSSGCSGSQSGSSWLLVYGALLLAWCRRDGPC